VEKWLQLFRQGRESTEDDPRSGRPTTSTSSDCVEAVRTQIESNRKLTTREIAETLDISIGSVVEIFRDHLGMSKISSRWVPRLLTNQMKATRRDLSLVFMNKFDQAPNNFLERIVTGDETWLYLHDPESKQASMEWRFKGERAPIKPKMVRSAGKVMATVSFDAHGVILVEYLGQGKTVTGARYDDVLTSLREAIKDKRQSKLAKGIIFHHDNAPAHTSNRIQDSLRRHCFEILPHPPYSPDLAPCDFHLFPKIKRSMKGKRFGSLDEVKRRHLKLS
jgi:histone-lysine N-methyltransferase SETMAR